MARRRPKRKDEFYSAAGAKKLLAEAGDDPYTLRNRFGMLDGFMFKFEGLALVDDIKRGIEDTEGFLHGKYVVRGIIPWFGFDKHVDRYSFPNVNGAIQAIVDQYEYPNHPTPSCVKETQISFQHGPDNCNSMKAIVIHFMDGIMLMVLISHILLTEKKILEHKHHLNWPAD
jgi:hypothetical protein